jgi:thiamine biosynthesis protein ThiS
MKLTVNGDSRSATTSQSVRELIVEMGLANAVVAVELNKQIVPRKAHESTELTDGDTLEIVTLVGGG